MAESSDLKIGQESGPTTGGEEHREGAFGPVNLLGEFTRDRDSDVDEPRPHKPARQRFLGETVVPVEPLDVPVEAAVGIVLARVALSLRRSFRETRALARASREGTEGEGQAPTKGAVP